MVKSSLVEDKNTLRTLGFFILMAAMFSGPLYAGEPLTVAAVGDIMMGTDYPVDLLPPNGGESIFDNVKGVLRGNDIVFGNLEGPITDGGEPAKCKAPSMNCYEFRTPVSFTRHLKGAGFKALNIANNHALDFGLEGVESTIRALESAGISAVGGVKTAHFEVKGARVAVAGFSYVSSPYSYPIRDIENAMEVVAGLKKSNDLVIVSFHGGAEGKDAQHVTGEAEEYLGEKRGNVAVFSHAVIDAGADMVLGHGPHVLRAVEVYKGKLIAYSLGNFLTYERFNISGPNGLSVILKAKIDPVTHDFIEGELVPVRILDKGIPALDPGGEAIHRILSLTREDIASPNIRITPEGALHADSANGIESAKAEK